MAVASLVGSRRRAMAKTRIAEEDRSDSLRWYHANKERAQAREKAWRRENRAYNLARKRRFKLLKDFGITVEEYERMLAAQGGVCAICLRDPKTMKRRLNVDHCHTTGKVRGLLCTLCNKGIGYLREDPFIFFSALGYLQKHAVPNPPMPSSG